MRRAGPPACLPPEGIYGDTTVKEARTVPAPAAPVAFPDAAGGCGSREVDGSADTGHRSLARMAARGTSPLSDRGDPFPAASGSVGAISWTAGAAGWLVTAPDASPLLTIWYPTTAIPAMHARATARGMAGDQSWSARHFPVRPISTPGKKKTDPVGSVSLLAPPCPSDQGTGRGSLPPLAN